MTLCTYDRNPILARDSVHRAFVVFCERLALRGTAVGRYVVMPEHLHLFIRLAPGHRLGATIGFLKKSLSSVLKEEGVGGPHWQPSFFDHLMRHDESYAEKWVYVVENPVRAGLVACGADWPYQGEIVTIDRA